MISFLSKNIISIVIIFLILIMATLNVFMDKISNNKISIQILIYFLIMLIATFFIPPLIEKVQYNANKPLIAIDIHEIDKGLAMSQYNIPTDKITYWVGVQNNANSPQTIKQVNLDLYFEGDVISKQIILKNGVNQIRQEENIMAELKQGNVSSNYKVHNLIIEGMLPSSAVVGIFATEPNKSKLGYYRMGERDFRWTWQLNGKDIIESDTAKIN